MQDMFSIDSSELILCNGPGRGERGGRPLGLLYLVMVIHMGKLRVRVYPRVGSGSNFRHGSGTCTGKHHRVWVRVRVGYLKCSTRTPLISNSELCFLIGGNRVSWHPAVVITCDILCQPVDITIAYAY